MRGWWLVLMLCLTGCEGAVSAPPELIGRWQVTSTDNGGGSTERPGLHLEITATTLTLVAPDGSSNTMGRVHSVDMSSTPRWIDLEADGEVGHGIYELDGDTLKLIVVNPGQPRPTGFQGSRDGILFTLKK